MKITKILLKLGILQRRVVSKKMTSEITYIPIYHNFWFWDKNLKYYN